MNLKNKLLSIVGAVLFALGAIIGLIFVAITTWGNLEAVGFYPSYTAEGSLPRVSCPMLMAKNETATISAHIENPLDRTIEPTLDVIISQGFISYVNETRTTFTLEPGDTYISTWDIKGEDAVYQKFVMARIVLLNSYPLDDLQAACSTFVVNTEVFTGSQMLIMTLAAFLLFSIGGFILWIKYSVPTVEANHHTTRGFILMFSSMTIGIIANFFRVWMIGGLALIIGVLLMVSSLTLVFYTSQKKSSDHTVI